MEDYLQALRSTHPFVKTWPHVDESRWSSRKLDLIVDFDWIAEEKTRTPRPRTTPLTSRDQINSAVVIKREASECCLHRHFGSDNENKRESLWKTIQKGKNSFRWLVQDMVPTLLTIGEIRVYVVGGRVSHAIHTIQDKGNWLVTLAHRMPSISTLVQVLLLDPTLFCLTYLQGSRKERRASQ